MLYFDGSASTQSELKCFFTNKGDDYYGNAWSNEFSVCFTPDVITLKEKEAPSGGKEEITITFRMPTQRDLKELFFTNQEEMISLLNASSVRIIESYSRACKGKPGEEEEISDSQYRSWAQRLKTMTKLIPSGAKSSKLMMEKVTRIFEMVND